MIKILKYVIVFIVFYSCNSSNRIDSKNTRILNDHKMNFPSESTNHFPTQIGSDVDIIYSEYLEYNNINLYVVERNLNENNINKVLNKLRDVKHYRGNDKNILIINRNQKIKEGFSEFPKIDPSKLQSDIPVPNFISYKNGIYSDPNYEFYIIHTDNKERPFKNEILGENASMPSTWKHGISYGVTVNRYEKSVIYWFSVW